MVGGALHHLLELLVVELEDLCAGARGVGERRAQAGEERVAPPVGNPLGGVLERVGHGWASSRWVLIRVRNIAACAP